MTEIAEDTVLPETSSPAPAVAAVTVSATTMGVLWALSLSHLFNDTMQALIPAMYPVLKEIKQALLALGARGALMSGSGSTVFGLFASTHALLVAERTLKAHYPAFVVERG